MATPENEEELLSFADHGTTAHVEKLVRDKRRVDRSQDAQAARAERRRLYLYPAEDGGYEIRGRLSPEVGSLLLRALEVAERKLYIGGLLPAGNGVTPPPQDFGLARWHGRTDIEAWAGSTVWHGERIEWDWALDWFCNRPDAGEGKGEGRREGGEHAPSGHAASR